jgi:SAM-dependent methyltransferase
MSSIFSFNIDYKSASSELCEIGKKYDTDKSSQRLNVTDQRHCHPYTLFYHSLFKNRRYNALEIAELGILEGSSLLMWREYFPNSSIYGFDNNIEFLNAFITKNKNNMNNIYLSEINVKDSNNIKNTFNKINKQYDIIIEDTTHQFEDQIRVIKNVYEYLKPGGILIIEDIFKRYNKNDYYLELKEVLKQFQDYYFVSLEHVNRNSTGWDNDKLFILVKGGAKPIFKSNKKITIITPSIRVNNLPKIKDSINFDYVDEWIIVYDENKITKNPQLFKDDKYKNKIKEYVYKGDGISGNPQRNYALTQISNPDTYLYYLDDDNAIHSDFYRLLNILDDEKIYTFNQTGRINGNDIQVCRIDSAMALIDYKLCKNIKWKPIKYEADGIYISECWEKNKDKHIYIDNNLCYYNYILY